MADADLSASQLRQRYEDITKASNFTVIHAEGLMGVKNAVVTVEVEVVIGLVAGCALVSTLS